MYQENEQTINWGFPEDEFIYSNTDSFKSFCNTVYLNIFNIQIRQPPYDKTTIENWTFFWDSINELKSRTIAISNIPNDATREDFDMIFENFGNIEEYKIQNQSKVIVRFFNLKDAMLLRISKVSLHGRQLIMSFTDEIPVINKKDPPNNGTIVLFNVPEKTSDNELIKIFEEFGEIREIRRTPNKQTQRFIEFYDKRSAVKAKETRGRKFITLGGIKTKINIEYSLPGNFRTNSAKYYHNDVPTIIRRNDTKAYAN